MVKEIKRLDKMLKLRRIGLRLRCVAAPIFDHSGLPRYSISVAGPAMRLTEKRMQQVQKKIRKVCSELSSRMGGPEKILT